MCTCSRINTLVMLALSVLIVLFLTHFVSFLQTKIAFWFYSVFFLHVREVGTNRLHLLLKKGNSVDQIPEYLHSSFFYETPWCFIAITLCDDEILVDRLCCRTLGSSNFIPEDWHGRSKGEERSSRLIKLISHLWHGWEFLNLISLVLRQRRAFVTGSLASVNRFLFSPIVLLEWSNF